jgi:hypothetical protein
LNGSEHELLAFLAGQRAQNSPHSLRFSTDLTLPDSDDIEAAVAEVGKAPSVFDLGDLLGVGQLTVADQTPMPEAALQFYNRPRFDEDIDVAAADGLLDLESNAVFLEPGVDRQLQTRALPLAISLADHAHGWTSTRAPGTFEVTLAGLAFDSQTLVA